MRGLVLTLLLASSAFTLGCTTGGSGSSASAPEELVRVKAILTDLEGQSVSVRDVEIEVLGSSLVQHRRDELLFMVSPDSDDHAVYPLAEIKTIEFLEPVDKTHHLHAVKLTLRSGKVLNMHLFRFKSMRGKTLDEGAPFVRTVQTLKRIDVLSDASKE